jgi:hypothetical protein
MNRIGRPLGVAALLLAVAGLQAPLQARHPTQLLPDSAILYWEVSQPDALWKLLLDSPVSRWVQSTPQAEAAWQQPGARQLQAALEQLEGPLEMPYQQALRVLTSGGIFVSFEPLGGRITTVIRSGDAALLARLDEAVRRFLQQADDAVQPRFTRYAGSTIWSLGGQWHYAVVNDLLLLSNVEAALRSALDRHSGIIRRSLADTTAFSQARQLAGPQPTAWGYVQLDLLRLLPGVGTALGVPSGNLALEFLAGGVLDALRRAPWAAVALHVHEQQWKLRILVPHDVQQTDTRRKWYFAVQPENSTYAPLRPPGTMVSLSLHRDLAGLWTQRDELFNETVAAQLAQADTALGLFFSGRDFTTQVLDQLGSRWQFVVARRTFADDAPRPTLRLPAFALVMEVQPQQGLPQELLAAYQKAVGLGSLAGAMQGYPALLMSTESYRGATLWKAQYLVPPGMPRDNAPVVYNFAPSCAMVGDRFVLASTPELARSIVDQLHQPEARHATPHNLAVQFDPTELAAVLSENRAALVAQTLLQEGTSPPQAEAQVDLLLELLRRAPPGYLRLTHEGHALVLEAGLQADVRP